MIQVIINYLIFMYKYVNNNQSKVIILALSPSLSYLISLHSLSQHPNPTSLSRWRRRFHIPIEFWRESNCWQGFDEKVIASINPPSKHGQTRLFFNQQRRAKQWCSCFSTIIFIPFFSLFSWVWFLWNGCYGVVVMVVVVVDGFWVFVEVWGMMMLWYVVWWYCDVWRGVVVVHCVVQWWSL